MKKKKYTQLSQFERDRIDALLDRGHKQKEVAKIIDRDESTISREIKRNKRKRGKKNKRQRKYEASLAGLKSYTRRKYAKYQGKKINEDDKLRESIINGLGRGWSPDEISGRMKKQRKLFYASKTAIYEWLYSVWGQRYCRLLFSRRYNPKRRKIKKTKKNLISNRKGIELRPLGATNKTRYGHYEGDTIVSGKKTGSKEALAVAYERKAKYVDIKKIKALKPALMNSALTEITDSLLVKSITLDNGIENQDYEQLGIPTFFCDPYSSWQKGGVENINRLIRRYVPKGSDIADYSDEYISQIVELLNNKPRKSLGYKTPMEVMREKNLFINNKKTEVALRG